MPPYQVMMDQGAVQDLESIHQYIAANDSPERAAYVLGKLEELVSSLAEFPGRGHHPVELEATHARQYRQLLFKPYRIIYQVIGEQVVIHLIADGRRDMQALLRRRLLSTVLQER